MYSGSLGSRSIFSPQVTDVDVDRAWIAVVGASHRASRSCCLEYTRPGLAASARRSSNSTYVSCTGAPCASTARRVVSMLRLSCSIVSCARADRKVVLARRRPDAAPELADRERLGDVVVRPDLEPENLVDLVVPRRQHDDWDGAHGAHPAANLQPSTRGSMSPARLDPADRHRNARAPSSPLRAWMTRYPSRSSG